MPLNNNPKICSACLLGVPCRFDGRSKPNDKVIKLSKKIKLVPVCPEELGGLPTPRPASGIFDDKVINEDNIDVTENFQKGAEAVFKIAMENNCAEAILKQRSPSCGCGQIFEGLSKKIIAGDGITTRLLKKNNIRIITEEDL